MKTKTLFHEEGKESKEVRNFFRHPTYSHENSADANEAINCEISVEISAGTKGKEGRKERKGKRESEPDGNGDN